jgi:hypothetical protein
MRASSHYPRKLAIAFKAYFLSDFGRVDVTKRSIYAGRALPYCFGLERASCAMSLLSEVNVPGLSPGQSRLTPYRG